MGNFVAELLNSEQTPKKYDINRAIIIGVSAHERSLSI